MKSRRRFLAALSATGMSLALSSRRPQAAEPSPQPTASPPPSSLALAAATAMRRFDPRLSDAQIRTIARGIDDNLKAAATLDNKKKRLKNSDEPVTTFAVAWP